MSVAIRLPALATGAAVAALASAKPDRQRLVSLSKLLRVALKHTRECGLLNPVASTDCSCGVSPRVYAAPREQ